MKTYLLIGCLILSGCAQLSRWIGREESSLQMDPVVAAKLKLVEENEIINAEKVLAEGRFEEAIILFKDFQKRRPQSVYFESARLGEAGCLEYLSQPQNAINLYRDIFFKNEMDQPKIAALALYRMAVTYGALGEDAKMVAGLLDTKKWSTDLPVEVSAAQVPAKLATIYARQNRDQEALAYLNEADQGIAKLIQLKGKDLKPEWLAKIYVEMGAVSIHQLTLDNFENVVHAQKIVQIYLFKAMKQNDPIWSARAKSLLQDTYRDLYLQMESAKDPAVRSEVGGSFVDLMDQAELFKPLKEQKSTVYEKEFFSYLEEVRQKTEKLIYGNSTTLSLTEESEKLNSIKRSGQIKTKSYIPLPPKIVPSEDPNL